MEDTPWWRNTRGEAYVAVQLVLMALVAAGPWMARASLEPAWRGVALAAGVALLLLGAALGIAGLAALGRNLTPLPRPKAGAELVERGAYAWVRHPIYGGLALAAFGWAIAWASWPALAFAAALLALFHVKAEREERWLVEAYPGYEAYRRRVKRLIPFLY